MVLLDALRLRVASDALDRASLSGLAGRTGLNSDVAGSFRLNDVALTGKWHHYSSLQAGLYLRQKKMMT